MIELAIVLLIAAPPALGASYGFRVGDRRRIAGWVNLSLSWGVGVAAVHAGFRASLFTPLGLLTPVAAGALVAAALFLGLRHRLERSRVRGGAPTPATRLVGALVGMAGGLVIVSSSWLGVVALDGWCSSRQSRARDVSRDDDGSWLHVLVRTANQGFFTHLPVIGPATDEIESLIFVLNADPLTQKRLAEQRGWVELKRLPSFRAIMDDLDVLDAIDSVAAGDLTALYRLQRNRKVIEFFSDDQVQAALAGARPTQLARAIARMSDAGGDETGDGRVARRRRWAAAAQSRGPTLTSGGADDLHRAP